MTGFAFLLGVLSLSALWGLFVFHTKRRAAVRAALTREWQTHAELFKQVREYWTQDDLLLELERLVNNGTAESAREHYEGERPRWPRLYRRAA